METRINGISRCKSTHKAIIIGSGAKGAYSDAPGSGNEHKFLSYAHAITSRPEFELIGFVDSEISKTVKATKIYGGWGAKNINFIEHEYINIDVAIVSTPDETHYKILKQLANYPHKLVICEKPLTTDLNQAREIVELYKAKNTPLMVDYTRRFIPYWQEAKAEIDSGKAGRFLKGYCYYNRGTLHTLSHFTDLALWFNGNMDNIIVREVPTDYRWVFQWGMFYENEFYSEHAANFAKDPHVNGIYDQHLYYVMDNAFEFLEGRQRLLCTGEDALRALEECYKFMGLSI
ncbi:MAG: Gfo/Idh/MocA family oxidoreductase [Candidatus Paceibacterota bacterium]